MEVEKDEIKIGVSKNKAVLQTAIALGFVALLLWALIKVEMLPIAYDRTFLMISFSVMLIAFAFASFSGLRKIVDSSQGLVINNVGIQINIGPNCGDFVKWSDVTRFKVHNPPRGPLYLLIFVSNPDDYLSNSIGLKKFLVKMNNVSHKTPLSLTSNWLECSFDELVSTIKEKYKNRLRNCKS